MMKLHDNRWSIRNVLLVGIAITSICFTTPVYSAEQIVDFTPRSVPVLNDELRRIDKELRLAIPPGIIVMWSGMVADIPTGWVLCDGNNGTPDLTDKFVIHADADSGGTRDVDETGGDHGGVGLHKHTLKGDTAGGGLFPLITGNTTGTTGAPGSMLNAGTAEGNMPKYHALAYIMKT